MTTQTIPRALLRQLTSNPQVIRYLEQIGEDAAVAPLALEQVQFVAQDAARVAASAITEAHKAARLAGQLATEQAVATSLRSQVHELARRVAQLETLVLGNRP